MSVDLNSLELKLWRTHFIVIALIIFVYSYLSKSYSNSKIVKEIKF